MSEEIPLSLNKEKFMKYLAGDVSFEEWKDGEMLHSLMVSNPLATTTTEQTDQTTTTGNEDVQHQIQGTAGPSETGAPQNSPSSLELRTTEAPQLSRTELGSDNIQTPQTIHNWPSPGTTRAPQTTRDSPGPSNLVVSQQMHSYSKSGGSSQSSQRGSSPDTGPRAQPILVHPIPSMGLEPQRDYSSTRPNTNETTPLSRSHLGPSIGQMLPPVQRESQAGCSGQGQSQLSPSSSSSLMKTPVRRGVDGTESLPSPSTSSAMMKTPVQRGGGSAKSGFVTPKTDTPGSSGASQTSLGGNFLVIFDDNSLVIKLPDIKKEVELDEAEPEIEEAPVEEVETVEAESGGEGATSEDSTDTEIQKNIAELRKMGIKATNPQTPIRRGRGGQKGPRVNRVPKPLAGLMGEANLCFARGEYDAAALMCLEVVRQVPKCAEPYQLLSLLYEEKGEHEQSLEFAVLGAHLLSHDAEEWRRVIEMCLDQNNRDMALYCYTKAIMYTRDKVRLLREKISLLKEMGDSERIYAANRTLLRYLPAENAQECLQLAREMTMLTHQNNDTKTAMQIMSEAIEKHKDHIAYEDINMMADLLLSKKDFRGAMGFLVKYSSMALNHVKGKRKKSADTDGEDPLGLATLSGVVVPDDLPVDLRASLGICLIQLDVKQTIIQSCLAPLFKEGIASFGDLYLDVAEAYTDRGNNKKARPILAQLVRSQAFNQPAVWLRYADCLNSLGDWIHAAVAYKKVLREVPAHLEARLSLATIEQQAGRTASALELLSIDVQEGEPQDIQLAYRKCLLLHNAGKYEEFADLAVGLVVQYYSKGATENMDINDDINLDQFTGDISIISHTEWYSLLVMACRGLKTLGRYQEMSDIAQMAYNNERMKEHYHRNEFDNIVLLLIFAHFFNKKFATCYNMMRTLARQHADNNRFMNLFSLVTSCANMSKHYRFCLRMTIRFHPENLAFCIMNGFNTMMRGSYKHALGEFVRALRQDMESPIINMCVGLCFFHLANQKFTDKKHSIILQGFAFLKRYEKYRNVCQETCYNIGRALHGSGLLHLAVHYYHRALEMSPPIADERFDLRCEVAHNLSLIYVQSNNREMATEILSKYCII